MFSLETVLALMAGGLLYWFPIRRWSRRWGATDVDLARPMSGDSAVSNPTYATTFAVTIAARPEHVWPARAEGYRRGGLYSYHWLDRLFGFLDGPSAGCILPEYQDLEAGDVIPIGATVPRADAAGRSLTADVTCPLSRARRGRNAPGPRPRPVSQPHGRTLP
jgi:hypothetical protein